MPSQIYTISVPLTPRDAQSADALRAALDVLCAADPTLGVEQGAANDFILKGQSELQLERVVDLAKRAFKVEADVGAPQVAYCETITRRVVGDYVHKRQTGGSGQYAHVKIILEPGARGSGFLFENAITGGAVPDQFIPGVEHGLADAGKVGMVAGLPVIDVKCTLIDGDYHDVDSSVATFRIAARACFREAMPKARPIILEPMMKVVVVTPQDHMGDVIGDLNSRRGQVQDMDTHGSAQVITAMVPAANLFGYVSALQFMTQYRAQFTMQFDHYEQVPPAGGGDDNFPGAAALRW